MKLFQKIFEYAALFSSIVFKMKTLGIMKVEIREHPKAQIIERKEEQLLLNLMLKWEIRTQHDTKFCRRS